MKIYQCTRCGKISLTIREANKHILSDEGKKNGCIGSRVLHAIHLPLKAEWYDMIESGEKKEEYRLLSCHWLKHLCYNWQIGERWDECKGGLNCRKCLENEYMAYPFDAVVFRYGYTKRFMVWSIDGISIGQGRTEWGAPENKETFIIKLKEKNE